MYFFVHNILLKVTFSSHNLPYLDEFSDKYTQGKDQRKNQNKMYLIFWYLRPKEKKWEVGMEQKLLSLNLEEGATRQTH